MEKQTSKLKSPFKMGKYKSFLAFLSPSAPKHPLRQKNSAHFHSAQSIEDENLYKKQSGFEVLHHSSDSIYSTIRSLNDESLSQFQLKMQINESLNVNDQSQTIPSHLIVKENSVSDVTALKEPIYASVSKVKKKKQISDKLQFESLDIQEFKEDNRILKERLKDLAEDNRLLRKKLQDLLKEEKEKEENIHYKLQLKITELEAETRKDVKCLSDRIQILLKEKENLNDQIDILQMEKKAFQIKNEDFCKRIRSMVSPEMHKSTLMEYEKKMSDSKKRNDEENDKLKGLIKELEESKSSLKLLAVELENKLTANETKLTSLEKINKDLLDEKSNYLIQAEESRQMERDMQTLLLSLLKMTENIAMERNVLLNKTSFQDHQQKEIQSTVIDYSLNIGRLQEHILNLNRDNHHELIKYKTNKHHQDKNLQLVYAKQLDILREKILAQHNIINDLENEKRKLESQLELIWQAACGTNSKLLEDIKSIVHIQTLKDKS